MAQVQLDVKIDQADMDKVHAMLGDIEKAPDAVMRRAVNRVLDGIKTDAVDEISKQITPAKKVIRKTFSALKMGAVSSGAWVQSKGGPLNLVHYKARSVKDGVTVQIGKNDKRVLFPSAFIAKAKGGGDQVFSRLKPPFRTKANPKLAWKQFAPKHMRLPIRSMSGPAVPDIMKRKEVLKIIETKAADRLTKRIDHEIEYELSKHR